MPRLNVNIDHVATLRQARRGVEPDPVLAAYLAELAGADGIVVHLREDRRHIQNRDLEILRRTVKTKLSMEMAPTEEMVNIAIDMEPHMVTLVPEKREEITTEGGLNVLANSKTIAQIIKKLKTKDIIVSLFIDPSLDQVNASKEAGADMVEIHTGLYSEANGEQEIKRQLKTIIHSVQASLELGLTVAAGHGLNYTNVKRVAEIRSIEELNIGYSIIARAVIVGMERAVREMVTLCK